MASLRELWEAAAGAGMPVGDWVCREEAKRTATDAEQLRRRMRGMWRIFHESAAEGIADADKTPSGLTGGDAQRMTRYTPQFLGEAAWRAATNGMAVSEANAKMRRIVACPTAGSCGILPAVLLTLESRLDVPEDDFIRALFTAGAVGDIIAENAMIAGAVGGCQAECGTAIAMAAAAGVEVCGGTTRQMDDALALGLKNVLGLVCDPIGGLVEVPCVKRNAFHAVHALVAIELALAGVHSVVPGDEVIGAMAQIGRMMPKSLRERSEAGLATTPTGCVYARKIQGRRARHPLAEKDAEPHDV